MLKNLLILIIASAAVISCGEAKDGIPFIAPQGSEPVNQTLEKTTSNFAGSVNSAKANSLSSKAIRRETIGVNLDVNYKDQQKTKADIIATVSFSESPGTCSRAIYRSLDVSASSLKGSKIVIEDFAEAQCMKYNSTTKKCEYLFLTITQTPSSIVSGSAPLAGGNGLVPAAVPVIMKNLARNDNVEQFIPAISENSSVLQVPAGMSDFQFCINPAQVFQSSSEVNFIIDSTSYVDTDYTLPYKYIGNGFF